MLSYGSPRPHGNLKARLVIALVFAAAALFSYYGSSEDNPFTGQTQRVAMSKSEEIALGATAAPQMARQYGGLDSAARDQQRLDAIGARLLAGDSLRDNDYRFDFHLLADDDTINAFALPGGQIFITRGLYDELRTEGEVAAVLGHEIGHVVGRHSAAQLAKQQLTQGLAGAAGVAMGDASGQQLAMMVGQVVNMRYGRGDELESDRLGVLFLAEAGYDPRAMLRVMEVLAKASKGGRQPEFFSTHPNPENRIGVIKQAITQLYADGVPAGLDS